MRVFGSVAVGDTHENSDVNILVTAGDKVSLFDLGGLHADLNDLIGIKVDVVTDDGISPYLVDRIINEAVPL